MTYLIDRRLQSKNKSAVNRERFLRRYKAQIKKAVAKAIKDRSIVDIASGEKVSIPARDVEEPTFGHAHGGIWEIVNPGNTEYQKGDEIQRPPSGGGSGKGGAGNSEEITEDDFVFELTREEFLNYFFEDLELPNMVKTRLASTVEFKTQRAGFKTSGIPSNIHVVRSLRGALGRRIALGGQIDKRLKRVEQELQALFEEDDEDNTTHSIELKRQIQQLELRKRSIPFLDPIDLRYSNRIQVPKPTSQAVMFCIMDVSGSMDEMKKDMAKRFFILLYLFLTRVYDKIDLVFIRHHTSALEVDEHDFFHSRESGGTVVSSALHLLNKILKERYPSTEWNAYVAQASDGDNWDRDSVSCRQMMIENIMPAVQYYAYVEITEGDPQNLWHEYAKVAEVHSHFAMKRIYTPADIYPVFRELFRKQSKQ